MSGLIAGCVLGSGVAGQLQWGDVPRVLRLGLMVGACNYLSGLLERKSPLWCIG